MKKLFEEIYTCRSRNVCLKKWVDCRYPEPFIGNLHARLAIIGANPGSYGGKQRSFNNLTEYVNYHEKEFYKSASDWIKGYCEAYSMLLNPVANLTAFNENAIILNVIKCSTEENLGDLPIRDVEEAKSNCVGYLIQQLANIKPRVVFSHGRFACKTIIEILRKKINYKVDAIASFSAPVFCDFRILEQLNMSDLSNHYALAEAKEGNNTLFLFNKHLSYGFGKQSLERNLDRKKVLVESMLR